MGVDYRELKEFQKAMEQMAEDYDNAMSKAVEEVAETLKDTVKLRTPVSAPKTVDGNLYEPYTAGGKRVGGSLKKAWDEDNKNIIVHKLGNTYFTAVHNNNYYASYVEDGHSQHVGQLFPIYKNGKLVMLPHKNDFIPGQHFLAISEEEINRKAPQIIEKRLNQLFKEVNK